MFHIKYIILIAWIALLPFAVGPALSQEFDKVQVEAEKVAEGVYMLKGAGGNIGVSAGADGVLLIDDQFAPLTDKIRAAVATFSDKPIRFVLNTHWHGDHTGGNENLGKAGSVIVAHDNVRTRMSVEQFTEALDRREPPAPPKALPVVTYDDSLTFHLNGEEIHAFHVPPAHTDGDSIVHFRKANVLHLGDIYFNGMYPFIDFGSGGSIDGMIAAADRALSIANAGTKIIPGHGPLSGREQLLAYRNMLAQVSGRVGAMVAAGKSLDEVLAARPTAELDEQWGGGWLKPERFVTIVYHGLAR